VRLTVARLGARGDGVAEGPVHVPGALPGEVVEGEVAAGRMAAPRIVTPSPDRVRPPCRHARTCGGCTLMHAADGFLAGWKQAQVTAALDRAGIAGIQGLMRPIVTSPPRSRRRAAFAGRRTRAGAVVGFHGRASETIADIADCLLIDPALVRLLPALRRITALGASRRGTLGLTATLTATGTDLAVTGGLPADPALAAALAAIAAAEGIARLTWDGATLAQTARPAVPLGRALVPLPPGAFLQATPQGEAALVAAVREAVDGAARVADLFAGCGTFALPLAEAAEVHAVEADAAMLAALDAGWRATPGLHRLTTEARDLHRRPLGPDELARHDAAVIDPPRAGAEAQARQIAASPLRRLAAVSCDPASFARDAAILVAGGFRPDWVQVVDQFRWSPHIEIAACFSRP